MADLADLADKSVEESAAEEIAAICKKASEIPKGIPGYCSRCDEHSQRLVRGVCAPCRDRYKLG